jgi:hypothetical protein
MVDDRMITCANCMENTLPGGVCEFCGRDLPSSVRPSTRQRPDVTEGRAPVSPTEELEIEGDPWGEQSALNALLVAGPGKVHHTLPLPSAQPDKAFRNDDATPEQAFKQPLTSGWRLRVSSPELVLHIDEGAGVVLGRVPPSPLAAHPLVSQYVSSRHARVWLQGGELFVSDLGSTNGTWLAGMKLEPGVPNPLQPGDVIQLTRDNPVRVEVVG